MAEDRNGWWAVVNTVTNVRVPYKAGHLLSSCRIVGFSRRTMLRGVSSGYGRCSFALQTLVVQGSCYLATVPHLKM